MDRSEIQVGSFVEMDIENEDQDVAFRATRWKLAYATEWPMKVVLREEHHVILQSQSGEIIHFGSTADARLHVHYVKLAVLTKI